MWVRDIQSNKDSWVDSPWSLPAVFIPQGYLSKDLVRSLICVSVIPAFVFKSIAVRNLFSNLLKSDI